MAHGFGADALFRGGAGTANGWNFLDCMAQLLARQPGLWEAPERVAVAAALPRRGVEAAVKMEIEAQGLYLPRGGDVEAVGHALGL